MCVNCDLECFDCMERLCVSCAESCDDCGETLCADCRSKGDGRCEVCADEADDEDEEES